MSSSKPIQMQITTLDSLLQSFRIVLQQLAATNQQISSNNQAVLSLLANEDVVNPSILSCYIHPCISLCLCT